jgi:hypothetical protein
MNENDMSQEDLVNEALSREEAVVEQVYRLVSIGEGTGFLAGAASVHNNEKLCKIVADAAFEGAAFFEEEYHGDRKQTVVALARHLRWVAEELEELNNSNDEFGIHVLTCSFVEGVLKANEDIETVLGEGRFQKDCPDSGCGGCTGC